MSSLFRGTPVRFVRPWLFLGLALLIASCGGGDGGETIVEPAPDPATILDRVNVSPAAAEVEVGATLQLNATALSQTGTTLNRTFAWSSSDASVATVSDAGLVTAIGAGSATVSATLEGRSGSATITVPEPGPPAAPTGLAASAISGTQIDLRWTDNSPDEDEFIVYREIDSTYTEIDRVSANTTTYSDTGLEIGATHRYRVKAVNARGESEFSAFAQATTLSPLRVLTEALDSAVVGNQYADFLRAAGGPSSQYQWSITAGVLPEGIALASNGTVSGVATEGGSFPITVEVQSGAESATAEVSFQVIVPQADATFEIELVYRTQPSAENRVVFDQAAARWGEVITSGLTEVIGGIPAGCGAAEDDYIDDLRIYVTLDSIDGPGSVLGSAGPCAIRGNGLSYLGSMTFDTADVAGLRTQGTLESVILHEMGHVLGVGTLWDLFGLLEGGCVTGDETMPETSFTGARAVAAWAGLGRSGPVPVYNSDERAGSDCGHWDEAKLNRELMTPFADAGTNPMSTVTIESLGDLGYQVDPSKADAYTPPGGGAAIAHGEGAVPGERLIMRLIRPDYVRLPNGRFVPRGELREPGGIR